MKGVGAGWWGPGGGRVGESIVWGAGRGMRGSKWQVVGVKQGQPHAGLLLWRCFGCF